MSLRNHQPRCCRILKLSFRNRCFFGLFSDADLTWNNFPDGQSALCQLMRLLQTTWPSYKCTRHFDLPAAPNKSCKAINGVSAPLPNIRTQLPKTKLFEVHTRVMTPNISAYESMYVDVCGCMYVCVRVAFIVHVCIHMYIDTGQIHTCICIYVHVI